MPKRSRHNFVSALFALVLLLPGVPTQAQQIVLQLKNGDRLSGKIASETTNQVVLTTTWSNNVTISLDWITKRETNAVVIAAAATNVPVTPIPLLPTAKAVAPPPIIILPKTTKRWAFEAQLGLNLQYNQQSYETYYGAFKAVYTGVLWRDMFDLKANYGKTDGTISANNAMGSWRVEHDITKSKRAFVFNAVDAGYDQIREIHFTYDESIGAGYKIIDTTNFIFSVDSGFNYQKEYLYHHDEKDFVSLRLAEMLVWKINPRVTLDEKFEFYPHVNSFTEYRMHAEGNLAYKLTAAGSLYINLSVLDDYDTTPAQNVSPNDLQVRSSLGLKF